MTKVEYFVCDCCGRELKTMTTEKEYHIRDLMRGAASIHT